MANERLEQDNEDEYEAALNAATPLRYTVFIIGIAMFLAMLWMGGTEVYYGTDGWGVTAIAKMHMIVTGGLAWAFLMLTGIFKFVPEKWQRLSFRTKMAAAIAISIGMILTLFGYLVSTNILDGIGKIGSELSAMILSYTGLALISVVTFTHLVHVCFQSPLAANHVVPIQNFQADDGLQAEGQQRDRRFPGVAQHLDVELPSPPPIIYSGPGLPSPTIDSPPADLQQVEGKAKRSAAPHDPVEMSVLPEVKPGSGSPRFNLAQVEGAPSADHAAKPESVQHSRLG